MSGTDQGTALASRSPKSDHKRIAERFNASHDFTLEESCAMLCYVGSTSHGTSIPSADPNGIDDVDLMGVILPPARYLVGLNDFEHWTAQWEELDVVLYGFHKFARLLVKSNPNVLGTLWLRDEDYAPHERWGFGVSRLTRC